MEAAVISFGPTFGKLFLEPEAKRENPIQVPKQLKIASIKWLSLEDAKDECVPELEAEFNSRADRWEKETAIYSAPGPKILHADYQTIMGKMGESVIPLILKRLPKSGSDWLWALEHITDENPAKNAKSYAEAVHAWLEWGKQREYI